MTNSTIFSKDPEETNNLINSEKSVHQNIVRELHSKILAKMKELKDPALELARKLLFFYPIIFLVSSFTGWM